MDRWKILREAFLALESLKLEDVHPDIIRVLECLVKHSISLQAIDASRHPWEYDTERIRKKLNRQNSAQLASLIEAQMIQDRTLREYTAEERSFLLKIGIIKET